MDLSGIFHFKANQINIEISLFIPAILKLDFKIAGIRL